MRLAIISDIHEDIDRLKMAMSIIEKNNVDEIVCLGDIVGYNLPFYNYYDTRNASECIQIVKNNCKYVTGGNHDLFEAKKVPINKAGFDFPDNWCEMDYLDRLKLSEGKVWLHERNSLASLISQKDKEYLYNLSEYITENIGEHKILFSHFMYPDFTGSRSDFVMEKTAFDLHQGFMQQKDCIFSFSGHAHFEGVCMHNKTGRAVKPFGKQKINKELQGFIGPCIAKGRQSNGFLILDTIKMEIEIIPLDRVQKMKWSVSNILRNNR